MKNAHTHFNITMPDAESTQIINIVNVEKKMKK